MVPAMWPFARKPEEYNRTRALELASKARGKGDAKKAILEYQKILSHEPDNTEVHMRVAPLFAERGEFEPALHSFRASAEGFIKKGFVDKAIAVYTQAAGFMPRVVPVWKEISRLQLLQKRRAEAIRVLLQGRAHFKARRDLPLAAELLQSVRQIESFHLDASLDLARIHRTLGDRAKARELLDALVPQVPPSELRRVRWSLFRLSPTPAAAWRWLRAVTKQR